MSPEQNKIWHYVSEDNRRIGPVSIGELSELAAQGAICPNTMVWNPEYPGWIPAEQISGLLEAAAAPEDNPRKQPAPAPLPRRELKPSKGSFLFPRLVGTLCIATVVGGVAALVSYSLDSLPWFGLGTFLFIATFGLVAGLAAYRKERYELLDYRLISHRGGLFSDEGTEFEIRNITHVKVKLPWLRYKLFRVGDVVIETAGTSKPMIMRAIHDPETIYGEMRTRMKSNGYDLSQSQLVLEEKPAFIGAIGECISLLFGIIFFCLFFLAGFIPDEEFSTESLVAQSLIGFIVLGLIIFLILHFLDLRRRNYRVFNDVVVYEEGFLTRHNAFIPYENIADSNTKQTFIDQILGLFDVQISCQGSGSEIKFRRLKNGVRLSDAIDQLVSSAGKKTKPAKQQKAGESARKLPSRTEPEPVVDGNFHMAEYRIHALRLLIPQLFLLPIFPVWIIAMFKSLVLLSSTRYFVRPDSLRHSYKFLTVDDREFSYEKITGLIIKRNLWDKWFNTMTMKFWSIGSGKALEFAHVHCGQVDLPALMRQVGIPHASEENHDVRTKFGLFIWLRARIWMAIATLAFTIAVVVAALFSEEPLFYALLVAPVLFAIIGFIRAKLYHARQRLSFHDHHIVAEQGILVKNTYHVRYKNVKRITSTRYPGGEEGCLKIYVAGEEQAYAHQAHGKNMKPILKQCSFISGMLPQPAETGRILDDILSGRIDPSPSAKPADPAEILVESPRSAGNSATALILLSILLFPLIALLPVTLPIMIVRVKRWRYRIEDFRIVTNHGILFRSETSVLLDRVDSLMQSQGVLNKVFRNGKVSIMTAGSSKPDLMLIDSPSYKQIHEEICKHTQ